jgi:hypothetical protein
MRQLLYAVCLLSLNIEAANRDSLFSITPEQMVFASKLSDPYRKIYCHNFSMVERQEALDTWKSISSSIATELDRSPDTSVKSVLAIEKSHPSTSLPELAHIRQNRD